MNDELKRARKEKAWNNLRHCSGFSLMGLRKTRKAFS
jgi:hypothetical protein